MNFKAPEALNETGLDAAGLILLYCAHAHIVREYVPKLIFTLFVRDLRTFLFTNFVWTAGDMWSAAIICFTLVFLRPPYASLKKDAWFFINF